MKENLKLIELLFLNKNINLFFFFFLKKKKKKKKKKKIF